MVNFIVIGPFTDGRTDRRTDIQMYKAYRDVFVKHHSISAILLEFQYLVVSSRRVKMWEQLWRHFHRWIVRR